MSFFAIAVIAAATLALANGEACDTTKLVSLLSDADVKQCSADTGLQPPVPPATDVLPKVCGNTARQSVLAKLKALNVGECTVGSIAIETGFIKPIETGFIKPIETFCAKTSAPSPATPTSPTPTTATPAATTTAPTPTPTTSNTTTSDNMASSGSKPSSGSKTSGSLDTTIEENNKPILSHTSSSSSGIVLNGTAKTSAPSDTKSAASSVVLAVAAAFM